MYRGPEACLRVRVSDTLQRPGGVVDIQSSAADTCAAGGLWACVTGLPFIEEGV